MAKRQLAVAARLASAACICAAMTDIMTDRVWLILNEGRELYLAGMCILYGNV